MLIMMKMENNMIFDKAHYKAGAFFPGTTKIGTLNDYVNGLPQVIKQLVPEYYLKLHGHEHKEWYSRK